MRIMWLHSHLSYWSGGTKFVFNVIRELSKTHNIDLFVQKSSKDIVKKFNEISVKVITLSKSSTGDIRFWLNFDRQLLREKKILEYHSKNYDVVISSFFPMNIVANSIRLPHLQYCFEPFAFFWDNFMIEKLPTFRKFVLKYLKRKYGKKDIEATRISARILTVNSETKKWIFKIYGKKSIPTLLGADTRFFKKTIDEKLVEKYQNKKIIIHSTDWTPLKRTNWLIDQFIDINSQINESYLLITEVITEGKERELAIKKIKENNLNVELCGFISHEMIPKYYSMADVAAYSGIGQGASAASLFVLECMSCETPVVRTNDTNEEVEHEKTGFLFDKNDSENFQKYIIKLLTNPTLKEKLGKNARQFIQENYSWKRVAEIFERNCLEIQNS